MFYREAGLFFAFVCPDGKDSGLSALNSAVLFFSFGAVCPEPRIPFLS